MEKKQNYDFNDFIEIMKTLIGENGCPWDKIQTHDSLKRYLIEECYEVIDAIKKDSKEGLCEELGDVLLQVVFHSVIAEKNNEFSLDDVIDGICKKMIFRHPHIFSDASANTSEEVLSSWEEIKNKEKGYKNLYDSLKSIPDSLPAIMRAEKVLKKAKNENTLSLDESISEIKLILNNINTENLYNNNNKEELIGQLLLLTINISKFLKLNPEFVLTNAIEKFINKFEDFESNPKINKF